MPEGSPGGSGSGPTDGGNVPGGGGSIEAGFIESTPLGGIILALCVADGCPGFGEEFEREQ